MSNKSLEPKTSEDHAKGQALVDALRTRLGPERIAELTKEIGTRPGAFADHHGHTQQANGKK